MRLEPEFLRNLVSQRAPSVAFAISFLSQRERAGARALFAFIQISRDAVNLAHSRHEAQSSVAMLARLFELGVVERFASDHSIVDTITESVPDFGLAWEAWSFLEEDFEVPRAYANEFIRGLKQEADGYRPESVEDLLRYTYRSGGVVGVIACHVLGLDQPSQQPAVDLASSARLYALADNVYRDFTLGRNFAPLEWVSYATAQTFRSSWATLSSHKFKHLAAALEAHARPRLSRLANRQRLAVSIGLALNREARSSIFRKIDHALDEVIRLCADLLWRLFRSTPERRGLNVRHELPVRDVSAVLRNQKVVAARDLEIRS